jgi:hypothetical protein
MKRPIISLAILIGLAIFVACQPNKTTAHDQNNANYPIIATVAENKASHSENQTKSSAQNSPDWSSAIKNPEVWLVLVGILSFIVISIQANEMRKATRAMKDSIKEVKRQADEMEKQTPIIKDSVQAAKDNAKAANSNAEAANKNVDMFINKERAHIRVELKDLSLAPKALQIRSVDFIVRLYGPTQAFIISAATGTNLAPESKIGDPDLVPFSYEMSRLPSVITPTSPPFEDYTIFFTNPDTTATDSIMTEIREDRLFVEFRGHISYKDVFGNERQTRFRYVWKYSKYSPIGKLRRGSWEKCGAPEDNQET